MTGQVDEPPRNATLSDLWWHLMDDHGLSLHQIHGNAEMMHAVLHGAHGCVALPGKEHDHNEQTREVDL